MTRPPVLVEDALAQFGWDVTADPAFWTLYHDQPWVYNLANAVRALTEEVIELRDRVGDIPQHDDVRRLIAEQVAGLVPAATLPPIHQWRSDSDGRYWCPCGRWEDHAPTSREMSLRFIAHLDDPRQIAAYTATHTAIYGKETGL